MEKIKINKVWVCCFYFLGILGMAVFALWDLPISLELCDRQSLYGLFIEGFGDYPLYLMLGVGCGYLFAEEKGQGARRLLWAMGELAAALLCGLLPVYRLAEIRLWHFAAVPAFLVLFSAMGRTIPEEKRKAFHQLALFAVVYFVAAQVIAYGIKIPWGRLRFRDMTDPLVQFTPWYLPQGLTGNHSFPSGHTFNSCSVLLLLYGSQIWNIKNQRLCWIAAGGWIGLVAAGRIVAGAHFASDVTMGAMLGTGVFLVMNRYASGRCQEKKAAV